VVVASTETALPTKVGMEMAGSQWACPRVLDMAGVAVVSSNKKQLERFVTSSSVFVGHI